MRDQFFGLKMAGCPIYHAQFGTVFSRKIGPNITNIPYVLIYFLSKF